jgi:ribonuclease Z
MAPASVIEQEKYKEWMSRFHPQAQHVIVNPHHCTRPIVFESSAANQMRLNTLHPIIFRACSEQMKPQMPLPTIPSPLKLVSASPLLKFHLSPSNAVGLDLTDLSKPIELSKIMAPFTGDVHPSFTKNRSALRDRINAHNLAFASRPPMPLYEPYEVIFLGTGAALPSKYRNVSSTLVKVKGFGSFLLDAGEGTYGQMSRYFCDMAQLNNEILQLRCIFISHMHADHHLGVARILAKRNELGKGTQNPPLLVIAPPHYQNWINEYTQVENLNIALFNAYELVYPVAPVGIGSANSEIRVQLLAELRTLLGFVAVEMVPVVHCPDAFGVVLKHTDGWSIVFSGDTRPCPLLDQAGLGCDLLIHEATFEDQLTSEAIDKNHATTTEAIQSATNMKAKFLMMTHFSQRYPKIPVFDERYNLSTGVAFDLMRVTPSDFPILPFFLDCLKDLFDEDAEPEDKDEVDDTAASSSAPPSKKPKKK